MNWDIIIVLIGMIVAILITVLGIIVGVFYDSTLGVLISFVGVIHFVKIGQWSNEIL